MRNTRRYLVDIDALMDTRYGLIRTMHPEALERLELDAYRKRYTNIWAKIVGIEDWPKKYKERSTEALRNAEPTELLLGLKMLILEDIANIAMSTPFETPKLTINMWPYTDLSDNELEAFRAHFSNFYNEVIVDLVTIPHKELTPGRLNTMWDIWFMFDWHGWLPEHIVSFQDKRAPQFVIHIPTIFHDDITVEVLDGIEKDGVNPFSELTRQLAACITVIPLDTKLFSLRRPQDQDV
ncbi:MAG: hypothetical protein ACRDBQ_18160 [Shewanella sp.]